MYWQEQFCWNDYPVYIQVVDEVQMKAPNGTVSRVNFCITRGVAIVLGVLLTMSIMITTDTRNRLELVCNEFISISDTYSRGEMLHNGGKADDLCHRQYAEK